MSSLVTPKKCTVDRILALPDLTERLRDFRIGLLAAYADLRKAFDSVNRDGEFWPSAKYSQISSTRYPACFLVQRVL